ncbi:uncharacterized protein LOC111582099 [Amphiprion ocellaris]|uniref:uncharacterized protein LOC111582099 n=1 Tax=Amphiprion ocellaris TaxID=80972 RepID=UPI0024111FD7|nr:uncharacterized protein LOC111582099 [Amphiprion ocellaris]
MMLNFLLTGDCQDVIQHPDISWSFVSQHAEMNCSHKKDAGHNQMYWYRQRPGETMSLIVYTVYGGQPDYGGASQTKYTASKEKIDYGALTVKDLQPEDSGVYFCAVSVSLGVEVHQTPAEVLRKLGEKVQLVCSHNKTDYTLMQWYQKPAGEQALKRIGHVYYGTIEHEKPFESNFNITGDMSGETAKNGSLFIADLKADHSVCLTVEVRQSPSDIITKPGDKVQVFCSHNETDYRQMFWYQRSPGDTAMKLIGYLRYNDATMEETYKGLFNITGKLGVSLGVEVHQSPSDFITKPGEEVQIFCSHDKTDFRLMLWYQRSPGETAMKLIGYLYYSDPTVEEKYKDNFNIIGDLRGSSKKNGSLKIQVVGPEQGAVYYCAASKAQ